MLSSSKPHDERDEEEAPERPRLRPPRRQNQGEAGEAAACEGARGGRKTAACTVKCTGRGPSTCAWLDAQAASAAAAGQRVVGFKIRPWQLGARRNASAVDADDREAALSLLRRRGLRVICNCRGAFSQTVSRLRSQMLDRACGCRNLKTGDGSKCGSCAALGATPLEPGPFVSKFRSTLASHRKLAAACAPRPLAAHLLWLPYEHLDGSRAAAFAGSPASSACRRTAGRRRRRRGDAEGDRSKPARRCPMPTRSSPR